MNCPNCSKILTIREGKFGEFVCCPSGHGTFSIQNGIMYFKGEVGQMLKNQKIEDTFLRLSNISSGIQFQPSLSQLMNAQMALFGWNSSDPINQLVEWAEGSYEEMWDDEERDDVVNWWNLRPY